MADIGIEVTPAEAITVPDSITSFILTLKNEQNFKDTISLVVSGAHLDWKIPGPFAAEIPAGETRQIDVMFLPVGQDYGEYEYTLLAKSSANMLVNATSGVLLKVRRNIDIANITAEQKETDVFVSFYVDSFKKQDAGVLVTLFNENGLSVASEQLSMETDGIKLATIKFGKLIPAGRYTINVSLEREDITRQIDFEVKPFHNVVKTTEIISNWLVSDTVNVYLHNRGNVKEDDYIMKESIMSDAMTGFITNPTDCDQKNNMCSFSVKEILPGETAMVSYKLDYWPFTTLYGLGGLVAIFLGHSVVFRVRRPKISKWCKKYNGSNHCVTIEIKNSFMHTMRNVIVRDWVSPLAKVCDDFDTARPILRRSDAGAELIWRLGDIKPQEERILAYRIKPLIGGHLKMPKAHMRFLNKKGKTDKIYSKRVMVKHT